MRTVMIAAMMTLGMAGAVQARMPGIDAAGGVAGIEPFVAQIHHKPGHTRGPKSSFRGRDRYEYDRFEDDGFRGRSRAEDRRFYGWERGNHYGWTGDRPPGWQRNMDGRGRGMRF